MEPAAAVELQHVVALDRDPRPEGVVRGVAVRHDGVQPVVAALQLDQNEQLRVTRGRRALREGEPRREDRDPGGGRGEEKIATFHVGTYLSWYDGSSAMRLITSRAGSSVGTGVTGSRARSARSMSPWDTAPGNWPSQRCGSNWIS